MFDKILIANRGEIACRVIKTARALGVKTVAVHSDADAGALHVQMADEMVHIGKSAPADSYLRGDAIIQAAKDTGAEAIHPGYGFLSENPDFVESVEAAGLIFIGPSAKAIRAMGLKDAAKALMEKAGVPVVPGYHGADQDDALLAREAGKIGYPVLIKAVAGGGGKGMRLVEKENDFESALSSARSEAKSAFGNSDVLIEKYITQPRHIEVQVFGDGTRAVHLFERDCSLQRRHQKVIEEAPAPGMTLEVRHAMGQAAVRAAEAIGYKGAGTIEFIVDGSKGLRTDGFWFMEMNTRLQVEHPVTEAITGVDLVEWQLRVASGEALPATQDQLNITGHAFEARLYAEDVPAGFLPATGHLAHLTFPDHCRADSGVRAGDDISPWYDPMIAKIITHGPTREIALNRLTMALQASEVAGTTTNLGFLSALSRHQGFAKGEVDTGLIARDIETLALSEELKPVHLAQAALLALGLCESRGFDVGFTLWRPLRRTQPLEVKGEIQNIFVESHSADHHEILVGDERLVARRIQDQWQIDGRPVPSGAIHGNLVTLFQHGGIEIKVVDPLDVLSTKGSDAMLIESPMPGLVRMIDVIKGQAVKVGDRLAVLEAMKMEHQLTAPRDAIIAEVLYEAGAQVEAGAALIRFEEEEA